MTDRLATDILVHEWNGANECIHGCLCVRTMQTWNQLCPNRVHELQQRYAKLKIERDEMWLTLLNEQGAGEPPLQGWYAKKEPWPFREMTWECEDLGVVQRVGDSWKFRLTRYAQGHMQCCQDGWIMPSGYAGTARQAMRDAHALQCKIQATLIR